MENTDEEVSFVSEKAGLVPCRDYPHARYYCAQYPFSETPHSQHCKKCYCYVCDEVAPCKSWTDPDDLGVHCDATDQDLVWKLEKARIKMNPPVINQQMTMDRHRLAISLGTSTYLNLNIIPPANDDLLFTGGILYNESKSLESIAGFGLRICKNTYPSPDSQFYMVLQQALELAWSRGIRILGIDLVSRCYHTLQRHFDIGVDIQQEGRIYLWNHLLMDQAAAGYLDHNLLSILKNVEGYFNRDWHVFIRHLAPSKVLEEPNAYALAKFAKVQKEMMQVYEFPGDSSLKNLVESLADEYVKSCL